VCSMYPTSRALGLHLQWVQKCVRITAVEQVGSGQSYNCADMGKALLACLLDTMGITLKHHER